MNGKSLNMRTANQLSRLKADIEKLVSEFERTTKCALREVKITSSASFGELDSDSHTGTIEGDVSTMAFSIQARPNGEVFRPATVSGSRAISELQ